VGLAASVIIRAKDEAATIERALRLVRAQTVGAEVIVVDSGSRDGTVDIARRYCDQMIEIPAEQFTYGHALNLGAAAASGDVHFALSAHCFPEQADWIERSLTHYARPEVAGTGSHRTLADGTPLTETFHQDLTYARAHPEWGFTNHASSWRASVWNEFPFDEQLAAAEDREWAFRVLATGYVIAFDPYLWVGYSHSWHGSVAVMFSRARKDARALHVIADMPPYRLHDLLLEWWKETPDDRHSAFAHRFLNYRRHTQLFGKYVGHRDGRREASAAAPQ